ncbi:hypothetical protein IJJ12_01510 [bacterium]|nr:hypothetical protein [bacterium]
MIDQAKLDAFMEEAKKIEKGHKLDLSSDEDLSIGIMNLISIEEHLFFTANKTGKQSYYDLLFQVREMRKTLLKEIIKDYEGEVWCISKHLLAASMRVMEVGTKALATDRDHAYQLFEQSYNLYNLFWALNLKLLDDSAAAAHITPAQKQAMLADIAAENKADSSALTQVDTAHSGNDHTATGVWHKLGATLNKMLDCCRE